MLILCNTLSASCSRVGIWLGVHNMYQSLSLLVSMCISDHCQPVCHDCSLLQVIREPLEDPLPVFRSKYGGSDAEGTKAASTGMQTLEL